MTVTSGLVVLVYGIVEAQPYGWGSARTIGTLALGAGLLALFVAIERRSVAPLVRLSIFKVRTLAVADTVLLLVGSGLFGMFFFASLYVQEILGYSPLRAGLAFLPVTAGIVIGAGLAQQLIRRFGVRNVAIAGISIAAAGLAWLTRLPVHGTYLVDLLAGLLPMSIGVGLTFVPITLLGTGGVREEDAGLASGLFNTAQQVGGSLGLAILSTLAASRTINALHSHSSRVRREGVGVRRGLRRGRDHARRRRTDPGHDASPASRAGRRSRPDLAVRPLAGEGVDPARTGAGVIQLLGIGQYGRNGFRGQAPTG